MLYLVSHSRLFFLPPFFSFFLSASISSLSCQSSPVPPLLPPFHSRDSPSLLSCLPLVSLQVPADEVCGCPLVRDVFELTGDFCRLPKRQCNRHYCWEKLRRAEVDLERVRVVGFHTGCDLSRPGLWGLLLKLPSTSLAVVQAGRAV